MNPELWLKLLNTVVMLGSVAVNVYLFFKSKADRRFAEMTEDLVGCSDDLRLETAERKAHDNELDRRLSVLETKFDAIPTHDDLADIRSELVGIGTTVSAVNERSRGTSDAVRRIEQHLLERRR